MAAFDDPVVFGSVCDAVRSLGPEANVAVPKLITILTARAVTTREQLDLGNAIAAIKAIGPAAEKAIPQLIYHLQDDSYLQYATQEALVSIGPVAIPALLKAINSEELSTRTGAAEALSRIKPLPIELLPTLRRLSLDDPNERVRGSAGYALREMGNDEAKEAFKVYLTDRELRMEIAQQELEKERNRLKTLVEVEADIPPDDWNKYPMALKRSFEIVHGDCVFHITKHAEENRGSRITLWAVEGDSYKWVKEWGVTPGLYFEEIKPIRFENRLYLHIPMMQTGTGHFREDSFYHLGDRCELAEVNIEYASEWFKDKLNPGEGVWKGEMLLFDNDRLSYTFYIWNDGDGNCCPSAGKVTGTYKFIVDSEDPTVHRLVVDTWVRSEVER